MPQKTPEKKKRRSLLGSLLLDMLLAALLLCVFALFHHVLPRWMPQTSQIVAPVPVRTPAPAVTEAPPPPAEPAGEETPAQETPAQETPVQETEETPPATEAPLTWRELFADCFTDEVRTTEDSYSSPNVSVRVEVLETTIGGIPQRGFIADVHVADIRCLRTAAAYNGFTVYSAESALSLVDKTDAVAAINGDYCAVQRYGLLVRNGSVYFTDPTICDICVLYEDGVMETYPGGGYDVDEIMARGPYQIWRFGPALLDGDGKAYTEFENTAVMQYRHPRTGLGYYEPGHYCFVVFEGRFNDAGGLSMEEFAAFFEELGCSRAYNMDGGASSVLTLGRQVCNRQSSERYLGDIIYVCEPEAPWPDPES